MLRHNGLHLFILLIYVLTLPSGGWFPELGSAAACIPSTGSASAGHRGHSAANPLAGKALIFCSNNKHTKNKNKQICKYIKIQLINKTTFFHAALRCNFFVQNPKPTTPHEAWNEALIELARVSHAVCTCTHAVLSYKIYSIHSKRFIIQLFTC